MEPIRFFSQLYLEMAQRRVSLEPPPPRRDLKQKEGEFVVWKTALTSEHKVYTWSPELPCEWTSLAHQTARMKRSHTGSRKWLMSGPLGNMLML